MVLRYNMEVTKHLLVGYPLQRLIGLPYLIGLYFDLG